MKINFRKISAVLASGIMTVSGAAFAAAANYPAPFIASGSADVAIVYGTGAGVSSLDLIQAGNIQTDLQSSMGTTGTTTTTSGEGDSFLIERTSTKYHVGDNISTLFSNFVSSSPKNLSCNGLLLNQTCYENNSTFEFEGKNYSITNGSMRELLIINDSLEDFKLHKENINLSDENKKESFSDIFLYVFLLFDIDCFTGGFVNSFQLLVLLLF